MTTKLDRRIEKTKMGKAMKKLLDLVHELALAHDDLVCVVRDLKDEREKTPRPIKKSWKPTKAHWDKKKPRGGRK